MSGFQGTILVDGTQYPYSKTLADLDELRAFIGDSRTLHMIEAARGDDDPDAFVIRHDVDHSAKHALRFAEWEASEGIRATYFLLPTAPYWASEARECGLAIQALGHEVGVHNDAHCEAARTLYKRGVVSAKDSIDRSAIHLLAHWACEMRSWGLDVFGTADHGGGEPHNVALWREPLNHTPEEAGLVYEAYLEHGGKTYISDNRGVWRAPLERREGRQTHILCHPVHWRLP